MLKNICFMYPHASVTGTSHLVSLQGKKGPGCFRLLRDLKILTHRNNSFFFSSVKMILDIYLSPPRGTAVYVSGTVDNAVGEHRVEERHVKIWLIQ